MNELTNMSLLTENDLLEIEGGEFDPIKFIAGLVVIATVCYGASYAIGKWVAYNE